MKQRNFFLQTLIIACLFIFFNDVLVAQSKKSESSRNGTLFNMCNCDLPTVRLSANCKEECEQNKHNGDGGRIDVRGIVVHDNVTIGAGNAHGNEDPFWLRIGRGQVPTFGVGRTGGILLGAAMIPGYKRKIDIGSNQRPFRRITGMIFNKLSDRREKENIVSLPYGLGEVMQLKPVTFTWKNEIIGGKQVGFIAQEVQEIVPEIVTTQGFTVHETGEESDRLSVAYAELIPVLVNAIQEQQTIIEAQKQQLGQQMDAISSLESTVSQLVEALQAQGIQTQKTKSGDTDAK